MTKQAPPTIKDVERGLSAAGFTLQKSTSGTSHTKWIKYEEIENKKFKRVVTVDAPKSPFSNDLIKSMSNQAGMTKKQFLQLCTKNGSKQAKKGDLTWVRPAINPD
jgi:hypothetical protein